MIMTVSQQESSTNSLSIKGNVVNNYKSASNSGKNLVDYRFKLTKTFGRIFDYVSSYKKKDFIKLRRKTIALACDCSIKTVTRALAQFHNDGVITKNRPFPQSPNILTLTPQLVRGRLAFQLWVNKLSDSNQEMIMRNGAYRNLRGEIVPILNQNVPTYTKKSNNNKYLYNKVDDSTKTISKRETREVIVTRCNPPPSPFCDEVFNEYKKKREVMLNDTQRNWISRNVANPNIREFLERPDIKPHIVTPLMEEVKELLKLEDRQVLKLSAIPDEAIRYTLNIAQKLKTGAMPLSKPIPDSFDWFCAVAISHCKKTGLQADFGFYKNLCKAFGVEEVENGEFAKPLLVNSKPRNEGGHSPAVDAPKMNDNERIGLLVKEIALFKEKIANPQNYFLPNVDIEQALEVGRALLAAREHELAMLLSPPVKIIDKEPKDMTPSEWLIWNRERKIAQLKAEGRK